ncbi:MAG: hypothetical protein H7839_19645 [Magnetococcus sp. YQC-5]
MDGGTPSGKKLGLGEIPAFCCLMPWAWDQLDGQKWQAWVSTLVGHVSDDHTSKPDIANEFTE